MKGRGKCSLWVCLVFLFLVTVVTIAGGKWKKHTVLKSDAAGYYAYLTSSFVYNDLYKCSFYPYVDSVYNPADGVVYYAVQRHPQTGRIYFKYTYGVAAFEVPFFMVAHILTKATSIYPADGYSAPYQLAVALSTVLFSFLGLLLLRSFLLYWFADVPVAIALAIIGFGTNYLAQVITQPGISHIYMFFLYALILYSTQLFTLTGRGRYLLGIVTGFAAVLVTRPTGVLLFVPIVVWRVGEKQFVRNLWLYIQTHAIGFICMLLLGLAVVLVQLFYWQATTGHWYFYTYRREYFDFANSQIINGLFSYRKGWFVYTPLALLGFAGLWPMWCSARLRFAVVPTLLYFMVTVYVVFSWWQWYYGGSFGCRVMVESLAVLALPLAALADWGLKQKLFLILLMALFVLAGIGLNLFQTVQYGKGILHWQKMNKKYYWRVFGKLYVTTDDKALLLQTDELNTDKSPLK